MPSDLQTDSIGLPDVISRSLNIVFCGINPEMRSAAVGLHFANRSNRFWRVLRFAGFTDRQLEPEEARLLLAAQPAFERRIAKYKPRYLAFLGKPACSVFRNQRELSWLVRKQREDRLPNGAVNSRFDSAVAQG